MRPRLSDRRGHGAEQEDELRQAVPDGQGDDPGQHAGQQQGQLLAVDDGHRHAEEHQRHQFGPPGIVGGPAGQATAAIASSTG